MKAVKIKYSVKCEIGQRRVNVEQSRTRSRYAQSPCAETMSASAGAILKSRKVSKVSEDDRASIAMRLIEARDRDSFSRNIQSVAIIEMERSVASRY